MRSGVHQVGRKIRQGGPFGKSCLASALILTASTFSHHAVAETVAGTSIVNTATLHYDVGGESNVVQSNQATTLVAERLDVALARRGSGPITRTTTAIPLLLTNRGNGQEAFALSTVDGTATPPTRFAIDVDGDGLYDPARDQLLPGATTPLLAPGATLQVLLLADVAGQFEGVQNTITARAVTGYGAPGTVFAGKGDNNSDAVVGPTGAQAQIVVPMIGQTAQGALVKTQSVLAPDGSARAIRGAIITYTLTASIPAPSSGVRIDDPIPAGTTYVAGSLMLDAAQLTDAGDGDSGTATGTGISVALGALTDPAIHTVQFKVLIQ